MPAPVRSKHCLEVKIEDTLVIAPVVYNGLPVAAIVPRTNFGPKNLHSHPVHPGWERLLGGHLEHSGLGEEAYLNFRLQFIQAKSALSAVLSKI